MAWASAGPGCAGHSIPAARTKGGKTLKSKHRLRTLLAAILLLSLLPLTASAQQEASAGLAPIDLDLLDRLAEGGTASLLSRCPPRPTSAHRRI